ncbi:hypothetical protein AAIR98_000857 [Elusimicrobium simillimum]|uniref:hypothetical protein n=1 Tax=Elusimicrobium simillimum TaxID=3143438 RepID=UPI003C6EE054
MHTININGVELGRHEVVVRIGQAFKKHKIPCPRLCADTIVWILENMAKCRKENLEKQQKVIGADSMKIWSVYIEREFSEENEFLLLKRKQKPTKEEVIKILRDEHYIEDDPNTMRITITESNL